MIKRNIYNQRGQTLVDLIVALALLSSSVASAGILSTASSRSSDEGGRRSQATALADRELEGLRSLRDQVERGADDSVGWSQTPPFDVNSCHQVTLRQTGILPEINWVIADAATTVPQAYINTDFVPINNNAYLTSFKRMVRLCPTNEFQQTNTDMTVDKLSPALPHAFTVAVTVTWDEANGPRQVVLNSLLSDYVQ